MWWARHLLCGGRGSCGLLMVVGEVVLNIGGAGYIFLHKRQVRIRVRVRKFELIDQGQG